MKETTDIRWIQRLNNFKKAISQMEEALDKDSYSKLEEQGLIQCFEYTYELAWKTLQDLLSDKGYQNIKGPRPVIEQSFQDGLIQDGEGWMKMLISRNKTTHTYEEKTAKEIFFAIKDQYYYLLKNLIILLDEMSTKK